jgi:ParB family transcriptional regulator, chromosome partitioning protein
MAEPQLQEHVFLIETSKIEPNPYQPRRVFNEEELRELANSIREYGILQPLVVTKIEEATPSGVVVRYQLIAGERRFRAAGIAGLERVPAIIRNVGLAKEKLELAIIENVQRANLNPIEAARAYARLQDEFRLTQREIAQRINKSREVVANTMRLLNLPTSVQDAVGMGKIGESQARLILSLDDPKQQEMLFDEILRSNLSVREIRNKIAYVKAAAHAVTHPNEAPIVDPEAISIKQQLEEALGIAVQVQKEGSAGKITIPFSTPEELYALLQKMTTPKTVDSRQPVSPDVSHGGQTVDSGAEMPVGEPYSANMPSGEQEFTV